MDDNSLLWGMLFGSFGLGYFSYGKKQKHTVALACGIGLMAFPYFVSDTLWLLVIGADLMAAPFFVRY